MHKAVVAFLPHEATVQSQVAMGSCPNDATEQSQVVMGSDPNHQDCCTGDAQGEAVAEHVGQAVLQHPQLPPTASPPVALQHLEATPSSSDAVGGDVVSDRATQARHK